MTLRTAVAGLLAGEWFPVYDDGVPATPGPVYAALWMAPAVVTAEDVAHTPDLGAARFQVTGVGTGPAQAVAVAESARDAITGVVPVVSGWVHGPVLHYSSQTARRDDDDPTGTVWVCTDQYEVMSARA